jgi:hypothetical protein
VDSAGNLYSQQNGIKVYMTGFPSATSGTPTTVTDSVGTSYTIYNDQLGNKYITYGDSTGQYYFDKNGNKTYINKTPSNLSTDSGNTGALWGLIASLQNILA